MPPDDYDARALALPIQDSPETLRSASPVWTRRSTSLSGSQHRNTTFRARMLRNADKLQRQAHKQYMKLTPLQRAAAVIAGIVTVVLGILFLVYNERIFGYLAPAAKKWHDITGGWLILWAAIFVVSFPPLIGYSSLLTIAGFVYGFPNGWFIAASATVIGSTVSFLVSRHVLGAFVQRLIAQDKRFAALALTLKHDGIKLLIMIRLCPLPFSLSNGALSTFPTVHWVSFALATAAASPKLMLHIFVGARLGDIAQKGEKMDAKTKAVSYLSMAIGVVAGIATGWFMYRKTKARSRELEEQERAAAQGENGPEFVRREYADDPEAGLAAETLREDDDDISLRTGNYVDDIEDDYRDNDWDEDAPQSRLDDPFSDGDGDDEEPVRKK